MNTRFAWVLAAAVLAGCSNEWSTGLGVPESGHGAAASAANRASGPRENGAEPTDSIGFANEPDRGDLLRYPAERVIRRTGAYTWHSVGLSEQHALRAIATGRMRVTSPDGTPIDLEYVRHVEHADGNWTWVGRNPQAPGQDALITFGPDAVFGSVPQGRGLPSLRVTMTDGRGWIVATDPRELAKVRNSATHPEGPDYLVPPKQGNMSAASSRIAMAASSAQSASDATTTVDILVGYTDGYASYREGDSEARTRIHEIVEVANSAFANSNTGVQLRLVHAMQVNYPDATNNKTALEELTGFKAPSTSTTPAPEFNALRSARDEYGADLVVLVRRFHEQENEGCGIAWLIGGDRSGISQSDEFFGYSVVSDGRETKSGKEYFCRDTTLVHEIGHNMGSQHDKATAGDSFGVYDYSFGYKTDASSGNFYTVMAYGDSGQGEFQVFSSPDSTYCDRPCGTSSADNARSLRQTAPTIASFRATTVTDSGNAAPGFDVDGNAIGDLLWHHIGNGRNTVWLEGNSAEQQSMTTVNDTAWDIAGVGDFNGDGQSDVLWRNARTGANTIWLSGDYRTQQSVQSVTNLAWRVSGIGDFNGDGIDDIAWYNTSNGQGGIWLSANYSTQQAVTTIRDLAWRVAAVGDFNGDGRDDLFWRNFETGSNVFWSAARYSDQTAVAKVSGSSWQVVGTGDFDGDGESDVVWRNRSTGANTIWRSADASTRLSVATVGDAGWRISAVGDFDGDGNSDLFWRHASRGTNAIWSSADSSRQIAVATVTDGSWRVYD